MFLSLLYFKLHFKSLFVFLLYLHISICTSFSTLLLFPISITHTRTLTHSPEQPLCGSAAPYSRQGQRASAASPNTSSTGDYCARLYVRRACRCLFEFIRAYMYSVVYASTHVCLGVLTSSPCLS
jgi:hypothetical protein